jgi:hypothetical protein
MDPIITNSDSHGTPAPPVSVTRPVAIAVTSDCHATRIVPAAIRRRSSAMFRALPRRNSGRAHDERDLGARLARQCDRGFHRDVAGDDDAASGEAARVGEAVVDVAGHVRRDRCRERARCASAADRDHDVTRASRGAGGVGDRDGWYGCACASDA